MATFTFPDFEDYQFLHHNDTVSDFVELDNFFDEAAKFNYEESPTRNVLPSDLLSNALAFADARKCDECSYTFTETNSPEVFGCGHMVCKSCFKWCHDFSLGQCSKCYSTGNLTEAGNYTDTQQKTSEGSKEVSVITKNYYKAPDMSVGSKASETLDYNAPESPEEVEVYPSTSVFKVPKPPTPERSAPPKELIQNFDYFKNAPAPEANRPKFAYTYKTTRAENATKKFRPILPLPAPTITRPDGNNLVLSFPEPVEFIMNRSEPIAPGSLQMHLFRYAVTADTVTVGGLPQNTSTVDALNCLKEVQIKALSAPTSIPVYKRCHTIQVDKQPSKMQKMAEDVPTILLGTKGTQVSLYSKKNNASKSC